MSQYLHFRRAHLPWKELQSHRSHPIKQQWPKFPSPATQSDLLWDHETRIVPISSTNIYYFLKYTAHEVNSHANSPAKREGDTPSKKRDSRDKLCSSQTTQGPFTAQPAKREPVDRHQKHSILFKTQRQENSNPFFCNLSNNLLSMLSADFTISRIWRATL